MPKSNIFKSEEHKTRFIEEMLKEMPMSHGEAILAKLAGNPLNGYEHIDPSDLVQTLDDGNFDLAIAAIQLRRYGYSA